MCIKVQIKNYQIIKSASLEFVPGLNVIIGPSNNGKSSILKAMKALIYTVPGTTSIRNGESSYLVGMVYNGHTVLLQKGLKESVYVVDGEKYTKYGVTTPEVVSNALNIKELILNGNKEQLNFWDQMDYPFLIDKTNTELFKFIVDSSDSDQISQSLKDMVSDRQKLSRDIDVTQGTINGIDLDIDSFTKVLEESKDKVDACNKIISLQSQISKLTNLKRIRDSHINNSNELERISLEINKIDKKLNLHVSIVNDLNTKLNKVIKLNDLFVKLHNVIGDLSDLDSRIKSLNWVDTTPRLDITKQQDRIQKIKDAGGWIKTIRFSLENKREINIYDFNLKEDTINKVKLFKSMKQAFNNIDKHCKSNTENVNKYTDKINSYTEVLNCFDACPYCGSKLHRKEN